MAPLVWLVTGCSSGFGQAFVLSILAKGDKVIATARGNAQERLSSLASLGASVLSLDISADQETLDATVATAIELYNHIDVLVNNAGNIDGGCLEEIDQDIMLHGLTNNLLGPLNLTRALLPHMRQRRSGTIIFQGSIGSYIGVPGSVIYAAAKGAIDGILPSLAVELKPFHIRCCQLIPGYFRTNLMTPRNLQFRTNRMVQDYLKINEATAEACEAADGNQPGDPKRAADIVVDAVHGDGVCAGKELPLRLPLGLDSIQVIEESCKEKMAICGQWSQISGMTGFETSSRAKL